MAVENEISGNVPPPDGDSTRTASPTTSPERGVASPHEIVSTERDAQLASSSSPKSVRLSIRCIADLLPVARQELGERSVVEATVRVDGSEPSFERSRGHLLI